MAEGAKWRGLVVELICQFLERSNELDNIVKRMKKERGSHLKPGASNLEEIVSDWHSRNKRHHEELIGEEQKQPPTKKQKIGVNDSFIKAESSVTACASKTLSTQKKVASNPVLSSDSESCSEDELPPAQERQSQAQKGKKVSTKSSQIPLVKVQSVSSSTVAPSVSSKLDQPNKVKSAETSSSDSESSSDEEPQKKLASQSTVSASTVGQKTAAATTVTKALKIPSQENKGSESWTSDSDSSSDEEPSKPDSMLVKRIEPKTPTSVAKAGLKSTTEANAPKDQDTSDSESSSDEEPPKKRWKRIIQKNNEELKRIKRNNRKNKEELKRIKRNNRKSKEELKQIRDENSELRNKVIELEDKVRVLTMDFREAQKRMKKAEQERDELQHEKDCKQVIFLLKDFDVIMQIAKKIERGQDGVRALTINERLSLKYMIMPRRVGEGVKGLLASQNVHGHTKITKKEIKQCKVLVLENDVYRYFKVKGSVDETLRFIDSAKPALRTVNKFISMNPDFGKQRKCISHRKGQITWKGKKRNCKTN